VWGRWPLQLPEPLSERARVSLPMRRPSSSGADARGLAVPEAAR
jgi:hypothetical protein